MCYFDLPTGTACNGEKYNTNVRIVAKLLDSNHTIFGSYTTIDSNKSDTLSRQTSFDHVQTCRPEGEHNTVTYLVSEHASIVYHLLLLGWASLDLLDERTDLG